MHVVGPSDIALGKDAIVTSQIWKKCAKEICDPVMNVLSGASPSVRTPRVLNLTETAVTLNSIEESLFCHPAV